MNQLEHIIRDEIAKQGQLSLEAYMQLALQHPEHGYYRVREPIGRDGDFITAPEVSQMFGEMIGIWCAQTWKSLGSPAAFALVEFGPGRGTMMRDILRATAHMQAFTQARQVFLVDSDKALRAAQSENLLPYNVHYVVGVDQLPPMPCLMIANEFFDALPVRQFEMSFRGWMERGVALHEGRLTTILSPVPSDGDVNIPAAFADAKPGMVYEYAPQVQQAMQDISRHLVVQQGAILVIDYGYVSPPGTATVQAVAKHANVDILDDPGEVDLTSHVDFTALAEAAQRAGAHISPVIGQGDFLRQMGIDIRADMLKKKASPAQMAAIDAALHRLIDDTEMGSLFKVMEVCG